MKIGDLFVRLGVQADTYTLKDFLHTMGEVPFSVAAAVSSLTGMSFGFAELVKKSLDLSNNLSLFRSETGLSAQELQKWTGVAKQVGLSGDVVQSSIMGVTQALAQMRLGHPDQAFMLAMGQLGVSTRGKSAFQILKDIGVATRGRDANMMSALLSSAHVNPAMMRIFGLPPGQFDRMSRGTQVMNEGDIRAMQDFQVALARFEIAVEKAFIPALTEIEPYMRDLAEVMGDLVWVLGKGAGKGLKLTHYILQKDKVMDAWILAGRPGHLTDWMRQHTVINNHVTTNVHSTADAEEVATVVIDGVKKHVTRGMTHAMKQFNNGGF